MSSKRKVEAVTEDGVVLATIDVPEAMVENIKAEIAEAEERVPKPGDPDYDWAPHYPGITDLYVHTFPGGPTVAMKPFGAIYSKTWLYKLRDAVTDVDVEFAAIDRAACQIARDLLMSLDDSTGDPINDLWNAWIVAGTSRGDGDEGLTPGNSGSSPG